MRCGSILGLSPRLSSLTTPDRGDTSAVSPQSLSVWVSQWPHGEEWNTDNPDLYDRDPQAEENADRWPSNPRWRVPKNLVRRQAEVPQRLAEWLAVVDRMEELLAHVDW